MFEVVQPYLLPFAVVTGLFITFELMAAIHIKLFVPAREVSVHDMFEVSATAASPDSAVPSAVHTTQR